MGKICLNLVVGAVLGFIPLLPQSAWAGGPPVIFYACVNAQGFLYNQYKGTHPRCRPGDAVTSWNQAGPRGFQGLPGPGAVVKDANGMVVGLFLGTSVESPGSGTLSIPPAPFNEILRDVGNMVVLLLANPQQGFSPGYPRVDLYYQSTDCTGQGLVGDALSLNSASVDEDPTPFTPVGQVLGTTLYYHAVPEAPTVWHSHSIMPRSASDCPSLPGRFFIPPNTRCNFGASGVTSSLAPFTTAELPPLVPPFHLELQP